MKVYAIAYYRSDKATGKRTSDMANSAVWRKHEAALAECRRHLENRDGVEPVVCVNTKTGKETVVGYRWQGKDVTLEFLVCEWPVY